MCTSNYNGRQSFLLSFSTPKPENSAFVAQTPEKGRRKLHRSTTQQQKTQSMYVTSINFLSDYFTHPVPNFSKYCLTTFRHGNDDKVRMLKKNLRSGLKHGEHVEVF